MITYLLLLVLINTGLSVAIPHPTVQERATWTDPAFSVSTATMAAAVTCPSGIKGKAGGIVFLIHGTGTLF